MGIHGASWGLQSVPNLHHFFQLRPIAINRDSNCDKSQRIATNRDTCQNRHDLSRFVAIRRDSLQFLAIRRDSSRFICKGLINPLQKNKKLIVNFLQSIYIGIATILLRFQLSNLVSSKPRSLELSILVSLPQKGQTNKRGGF